MKRFSSYLAGLSPWICFVAIIGFFTRFRTFGKAGVAPDINYLLLSGLAVLIYSIIIGLYFSGIEITGLEYKTPGKNTLLNCFDFSALMIVILLLLSRVQPINGMNDAIVICMISMAVSVVSLIAERNGRSGLNGEDISGNEIGGKAILAVIFAFVCGFSILIFNVAFKGIEKLSDAVIGGIKVTSSILLTILQFIANTVLKILEWIISLFPQEDSPAIIPDSAPDINIPDVPQIYKEVIVPLWLYYVLAAVILLAVIIFIKRNIHFKGNTVRVRKNKRVKRTKIGKNSAFGTIRKEIRFKISCLKNRHTVPGMLIYCEKHAPKGLGRRKGESGEAFLRRISAQPEILKLADMVEMQFYSPKQIIVNKEEYKEIIKAWNTVSNQ